VTREQRTVFGEVAADYERTRPGYPDELFDIVMRFGELAPGDRALEIGAGTGKATRGFVGRGLDVTALEPSPGMAGQLRRTHANVIESTFEDWSLAALAFRLVFAAQSWHWVGGADRAARAARALGSGGTIALFWNLPQPFAGALGDEIQAVYAAHAPDVDTLTTQWPIDETIGELDASGWFDPVTKRSVDWVQHYSTDDYVALMGTHSNHRILDDAARARLQRGVGEVIARHGGRVEVIYRTDVYLARRRDSGGE
jgi:SAM-dependent methyltransferase